MMSSIHTSAYLQIPIYSIKPESYVPFNIYRKDEEKFSLLVEKNSIFPKHLASLLKGSDSIYILVKEELTYYHYLEKVLVDITSDAGISLPDKSKLIYDSSARIINDLFEKPESKEAIERSKSLVSSTINLILSDPASIKSMMEIGSHDYYTYTHSVDVSVFSIGFANYLKFSHNDISNIGNAAMMHDIGKSKIPSDIINKKGKLNEEEFAIMKQHPVFSYEILQFHGETNEDILRPARNHHEKARGNGYPDNLMSHQTHHFAKIVAIADIFSALTTERSYKEAYSSFEALQLMKTYMIEDVDKNLFMEFVKFMSKSCR